MRIYKDVTVEQEVRIDLTVEDITLIFEEGGETDYALLRGIQHIHTFLKGVPDKCIAQITEKQRKIMFDFLEEQAERFREKVPEGSPPCQPDAPGAASTRSD